MLASLRVETGMRTGKKPEDRALKLEVLRRRLGSLQRRQEEGGACRHEERERWKLGEPERGDERDGKEKRG